MVLQDIAKAGPDVVVAHMVEEVSGGVAAMVLLVLWAFAMMVVASVGKNEITAALVWIGGNQILTTALIASRRRRYQISQRSEEQVGSK